MSKIIGHRGACGYAPENTILSFQTAIGHSPATFSSSIIEAAMPLAITTFALADQYKLNKSFIARSIVLSTILSAISLPFWISII